MAFDIGVSGSQASMGGLFRLPSTPLFLGLIPAFSGQARLGDLRDELSATAVVRKEEARLLRPADVRTFVAYSGPGGEARTSVSLFRDTPDAEAVDLQSAILKQFGPVGLKHFLGVLVAAEEETPKEAHSGGFVLDFNRHLDRLGYKRSNVVSGRRYHTTHHLAEAHSIVHLLCGLTLVQEIRLGHKRGTTIRIRLLLDEAASENWHEEVAEGERLRERIRTQERLYLRVNPYLFSAALEGARDQRAAYTYQLRQLVRENAQQRSWTLVLGAALPARFGLNGGRPVREKAVHFLALGGTTTTDPETVELVEQNLKYMVEQGYLSAFETERYRYETELREALTAPPGNPPKPRLVLKGTSAKERSSEETWQVEPPCFLPELLKATPPVSALPGTQHAGVWTPGAEEVQPLLPGLEDADHAAHAGGLLRSVRERLGLSQGQLARTLGYTQAAVSMAEAGKRPKMARSILEAARQLRPGGS